MPPKIVVCMIVKNEEEMLTRCLSSIKEADAIYISDTGSTDKTIEIAKQFTKNIYTDYTWNDNFAEARNHILNKVKEENCWILSIDADEFLHDFAEVRKAVIEAEKVGGLAVDCKLISEQEKQLHYYPRLFKKCPEVWWEASVHNHINVKPKTSSNVTITYGYSPAHTKDPERTLRILTKEVKRTGNPRETFYLGREHWYRQKYKECAETMEIYVKKAHFLAEKADAYLILARCYFAMGRGDDARTACMSAITVNPYFKEAVLFMAKLAGQGTGNPLWEKNAQWWEKASVNCDNTNVLFIRDLDGKR